MKSLILSLLLILSVVAVKAQLYDNRQLNITIPSDIKIVAQECNYTEYTIGYYKDKTTNKAVICLFTLNDGLLKYYDGYFFPLDGSLKKSPKFTLEKGGTCTEIFYSDYSQQVVTYTKYRIFEDPTTGILNDFIIYMELEDFSKAKKFVEEFKAFF
jgi:hypothetical protein